MLLCVYPYVRVSVYAYIRIRISVYAFMHVCVCVYAYMRLFAPNGIHDIRRKRPLAAGVRRQVLIQFYPHPLLASLCMCMLIMYLHAYMRVRVRARVHAHAFARVRARARVPARTRIQSGRQTDIDADRLTDRRKDGQKGR